MGVVVGLLSYWAYKNISLMQGWENTLGGVLNKHKLSRAQDMEMKEYAQRHFEHVRKFDKNRIAVDRATAAPAHVDTFIQKRSIPHHSNHPQRHSTYTF